MNSPEATIAFLKRILLSDPDPSVRIVIIESLAILGRHYPLDPGPLSKAATGDPDPSVRIAAIKALTALNLPSISMPEQLKIQMNFNAPVYGAAGNIEGNQNIQPTE